MTATKSAHGWRITWPMVLGWLGVLALLWPALGPYVLGEKPFDTAAGTMILATLLSALTHSPAPSSGGGLPRPPESAAVLVLIVLGAAALTGCGASWKTSARIHLGIASQATVVADALAGAEATRACPDADVACLHEHRFDLVREAIATARASILTGEAVLAREVTQSGWDAVVRCIAASASSLLHALHDADVAIPGWLTDIGETIAALAGPCEAPPS